MLNFRIYTADPIAGGFRRFADHVLACRIACRVVEAEKPQPAGRVLFYVSQLSYSRRLLCHPFYLFKILLNPLAELASITGIREYKDRSALHCVVANCSCNAADCAE